MSNDLSVKPENQALSTVDAGLPAYLQDAKPFDYGTMNQFTKPSRTKIIQDSTKEPFKPPFNSGDVIILPQMVKIGDYQTPFTIVPLHFYFSYAVLNPYKLRAQLGTFYRNISIDPERKKFLEFDPNSITAIKAKARKTEPCPENTQERITYVEILNWIYAIQDNDDISPMIPIHVSFMKGEYTTGLTMNSIIQTRAGVPPKQRPPFAMRLRAVSGKHRNPGNEWNGLNISNDPKLWIPNEEAEKFKAYEKLSGQLDEIVKAGLLEVELEDSDIEGGNAAVDPNSPLATV